MATGAMVLGVIGGVVALIIGIAALTGGIPPRSPGGRARGRAGERAHGPHNQGGGALRTLACRAAGGSGRTGSACNFRGPDGAGRRGRVRAGRAALALPRGSLDHGWGPGAPRPLGSKVTAQAQGPR